MKEALLGIPKLTSASAEGIAAELKRLLRRDGGTDNTDPLRRLLLGQNTQQQDVYKILFTVLFGKLGDAQALQLLKSFGYVEEKVIHCNACNTVRKPFLNTSSVDWMRSRSHALHCFGGSGR